MAFTNFDDGFFTRALADSDLDVERAITNELARQRDQIELIASENIGQYSGSRSAGFGADKQIRRRLPRTPLLWWLFVRRRR